MTVHLFLFGLLTATLHARPVEIVMIDAPAEKELGFPLDRAELGRVITAIERAHARAIVVKFFLDQPRTPEGDQQLEAALAACKIPVVLQACIDPTAQMSNTLAPQFVLTGLKVARGAAIAGQSGWIPLPRFAEHATKIAFIDELNPAPVIEVYQGDVYPSLYLATLELMVAAKVTVEPNKFLELSGKRLALDAKNRVHLPWPTEDKLQYVPLLDLLSGKTASDALKDKVVIIAYDGKQMQTTDTPIGKVKAHRLFYYQLCALYDWLTGTGAAAPKKA